MSEITKVFNDGILEEYNNLINTIIGYAKILGFVPEQMHIELPVSIIDKTKIIILDERRVSHYIYFYLSYKVDKDKFELSNVKVTITKENIFDPGVVKIPEFLRNTMVMLEEYNGEL